MEVNNKIFEWIGILKTKPKMIIGENIIDYRVLRIYVEGYIDGIGQAVNKKIGLAITHWFQKKVNQKSSYYWTNHIPYYYKNKTDEELKIILLDTTEEYFRENLDWLKETESN